MFAGYRLQIGLLRIAVVFQSSSGQYIFAYLHAHVAEGFYTVRFFIEIGGVALNGGVVVGEDDIAFKPIYSGTLDAVGSIPVGLFELYFCLCPGGGRYEKYHKQDNRK